MIFVEFGHKLGFKTVKFLLHLILQLDNKAMSSEKSRSLTSVITFGIRRLNALLSTVSKVPPCCILA